MNFLDVEQDTFKRFLTLTINLFENNLGPAHGQLEPLTAHGFNQNGQVQFTAT